MKIKNPFASKTKDINSEEYKKKALCFKELEEIMDKGAKLARKNKQDLKEIDKLTYPYRSITYNKYSHLIPEAIVIKREKLEYNMAPRYDSLKEIAERIQKIITTLENTK